MYDFDEQIDRRNTGSLKWDVKENELPMWVADMDFRAAPEIVEELQRRAADGIFGYSVQGNLPQEWKDAYINWWKRRHHFAMEQSWLFFAAGVMPAISSCVRSLTAPEENVLILTPVYNGFFSCILNSGRTVIESRLRYESGVYSIDFEELEEKLSDQKTSLLLFCNPHNPVGKIWDIRTLKRVGDLCAKHHVVVISDEIHCDLTAPGTEYVPFASVSEVCRNNSITCIAPTKCFNIAGLQTAAVSIPNPELRRKVRRALRRNEVTAPNSFAIVAAVAAFDKGERWLNELNVYIADNRKLVKDFLAEELPELTLVSGEATYLLWIDCRRITEDSGEFARKLRNETGLFLSEGKAYGGDGIHFVRLNIACPRAVVLEGMARLKAGVELIKNGGRGDSLCERP